MQLDVGKFGKKMKGVNSRDRGKEDHGEKETSSKQHEPTRIKIFEGGYVIICVSIQSIRLHAFKVKLAAPLRHNAQNTFHGLYLFSILVFRSFKVQNLVLKITLLKPGRVHKMACCMCFPLKYRLINLQTF